MSDITESFRNVFISQKNSGYLFELIINNRLLKALLHHIFIQGGHPANKNSS